MYLKFKFDESKALFIFINDSTIPMINETLGDMDDKYSNSDGFLYLNYSGENTFGNT